MGTLFCAFYFVLFTWLWLCNKAFLVAALDIQALNLVFLLFLANGRVIGIFKLLILGHRLLFIFIILEDSNPK